MKKVKIQVFYISALGRVINDDYEADTLQEAKAMVEENITSWDTPHIAPVVTKTQEDGMEYDRTTFVKYNFSHVDITDYTDGKPVAEEIETT